MTFDQYVRLKAISVPEHVAHACRFLESHGFKYRKHFRMSDAVQVAGEAIIEMEAEYDAVEKKQRGSKRDS